MADPCCGCRMCGRGRQYVVFVCAEGSDQLQEGKWMDVLPASGYGTDHCFSV